MQSGECVRAGRTPPHHPDGDSYTEVQSRCSKRTMDTTTAPVLVSAPLGDPAGYGLGLLLGTVEVWRVSDQTMCESVALTWY
jgi:hypothetical protein